MTCGADSDVMVVLSSEHFVLSLEWRDKDSLEPLDLTDCIIETGFRVSGTRAPAVLVLNSELDEIDVDDPTDGKATIMVPREIIAGLEMVGEYEMETRLTQDGVTISQDTRNVRFASGVLADSLRLADQAIVIDRSESFDWLWQFQELQFGVLEPVSLEDVVLTASLTPAGEQYPTLSFGTEDDFILIDDPATGEAQVSLPVVVLEDLQPGVYTLQIAASVLDNVTNLLDPPVAITVV